VGSATVIRSSAYEARRVAEELSRDLGHPVTVRAVLAIHGGKLPAWRTPVVDDIPLLRARKVRHWITSQTAEPDWGLAGLVGEACGRIFPPYAPTTPAQSKTGAA
jgi:hypothetical protein